MDVPRRLALRVGLLVTAAVVIGFVVVLILGSEGMLFSSTHRYLVAFTNVAGLREGAVVRLGGRDVGDVAEIRFGPIDDPTRRLVVTLRVRDDFADRVRADTVAQVASQGLLGDKLIELSMGSSAARPVADGGWLQGEPPADTSRLIAAAGAAAEHARDILARIDETTRGMDPKKSLEELDRTMASVRAIVERVETGPGIAHTLIFDEGLAASAGRTVRGLERASRDGQAVVASARRTADRLAEASAAIDPTRVRQVTEDVAGIVADVRAGRGTLGGLLVDPTLYEETKRILVNIRRNRVLKALARVVVSDEGDVEVMDAGPVLVRPRHAPEPPAPSLRARSRPTPAR
jgi:phospholipid/cholesterol/gamma-HCH transport system substrate-binding protein